MSTFGVRSEVVPPRSDAVSAFPTYGNPYFHRHSVNTDYRKRTNGDRFYSCVSMCREIIIQINYDKMEMSMS